MKNINQYIQEKYLIDIDTLDEDLMNISEFTNHIYSNLSTLYKSQKEISDIIDKIYIIKHNINNKYFKYIGIDNKSTVSKDLINWGAELINHPVANKKISNFTRLYVDSVTDLYLYAWYYPNIQTNKSELYLFFVDHTNEKFYIYQVLNKNEVN